MSNLSVETAKVVLNEILDALKAPENAKKLEEAKVNAGNEMLKMMQFIFPMVMEIEMEVIKNHGFGEGREGIVQFSQIIRNMERENTDIIKLHNLIRSYYLPPVAVSSTADNFGEANAET